MERYRVIGPLLNGEYQVWDSSIDDCIATFHNPVAVPEMLTARYYARKYAKAENLAEQERKGKHPLLSGIDETLESVEARLAGTR